LIIAVVLPLNSLLGDLSWQRRSGNLNRLTSCLNPAASMLASGLEVWQTEPIDDCLTESMMTPISSFGITAPANRMNVILVAVESLRPDTIGLEHQGQLVLPNISQLASQSYVWSNAYAQSTHSDYADLCLVSSLYPLRSRRHHFYHQDDPWPKQTLYDVLKPHGYSTAIISSQNEAWGCMNEFLQTENLDFFYHPQNSDAPSIIPERDTGYYLENLSGALVAGSFPDAHTADIAINWIGAQAKQNSPFYLSMNLQSSHFPYLIPDDVPAPFEPCELPPSVKFTSYAESDVPVVKNAYYNGIHECDRQVGRLIDQLKSLGIWENTIMVVTGENGEAFRENGCISHAGNPGEPTIRVASVLSAPGILGHGRDDYPFEHVDLVPTILGLMGSSTHGNFQGTNALSVDRLPLNERFLFAHVLSPIAEGDSVQYAGRWKLMTSQECPIGRLFDLQSDPTESTDISESHPVMRTFLTTALHQWRNRQLAYYYLPKYYTKYYPPRPPTVREICAIAGLEFEHVTSQSVATASRSD
jgi:arylsulfatase A-like enzyme